MRPELNRRALSQADHWWVSCPNKESCVCDWSARPSINPLSSENIMAELQICQTFHPYSHLCNLGSLQRCLKATISSLQDQKHKPKFCSVSLVDATQSKAQSGGKL
ncbi:hypothetical protein CRENBAI_021835 [Crenichthys baileyi]|uniref:Uncharacterized protein n=1 Tax=Crenichthys baileyi TaxID=28760 RepID=A0AAV9RQ71_9TELE